MCVVRVLQGLQVYGLDSFRYSVSGALAMNSRPHSQHHVWCENEDHKLRLHHWQYMTPPVKAYENHLQCNTEEELLTLTIFQLRQMITIRHLGVILEIGVAC